MLQTRNSQFHLMTELLDFSIYVIFAAAIWALGSTQLPTKMSTKNHPAVKGRLACKASNLTAIYKIYFLFIYFMLPFTIY
jgi:hypothetical protein